MKATALSGSFRRQIVVLTACVTAFAMLMLTVVVQLILAAQTTRDVNRVLEDRADAVAGSTTSASPEGPLQVPQADLDRGVVVYSADGTVVAGQVPVELARTYALLNATTTTELRDIGDDRRVLALPFSTDAGATGVVIVDEVLTPYEEAEFYALLVSLASGAVATAAAAALVAWVTGRALEPVAALARTAADWSEHDLSRRFGLGPPRNELTELASTLDVLLEKVSAAIRSEQRLTSELAHELRTPLTTILATADLARMDDDLSTAARDDLDEIARAARQMTATITALLELARTERGVAAAAVSSLLEVIQEVVRDTPTAARIAVDGVDLRLGLPHALAVRVLAPVVANAARFAETQVRIAVAASADGSVNVVVEDDGPGVSGDGENLFVPGATSGGGSGAGLGLALARRVARSCDGDVDLTHAHGPTQFTVSYPSA